MNKYAIVIEKAGNNFSAYCPDLPGCAAAARTRARTEKKMRAAVAEHLAAMRDDGLVPPAPTSIAALVSA